MDSLLRQHVIHPVVTGEDTAVWIPAEEATLSGDLYMPEGANSIVIFAHGSGSSRHSPRNQFVAGVLHDKRIGTLLMDLLTPEEEEFDLRTRKLRFNIELLTERLLSAQKWAAHHPALKGLRIGYFGASTGAAAALAAAARRPKGVSAVVCRGGRPDLAGDDQLRVKAPTLLIVGEQDIEVLAVNKNAITKLNTSSKLDIVPRATHLFEEPGTLEDVAQLASDWFAKHLSAL
ncbi:MAG TPA: dienelactone hydrolase family protein [Rickettsiales bacterium]|nr:dienelactone hydrolase family protein [Rickettsiales bacterium]